MKNLLLAVSFSLLTSTAFAADAIVEEAAVGVVPGFTWTGGYVGVHAGYLWADIDYREPAFPDFDLDRSDDNLIGGAYAGFNYQMNNNVVVGAEADFGFTDISIANDPDNPFNSYSAFDSDWNAHLRARLGYAVDRLLFFAAGGLALADLTVDDTDPGWNEHDSTYVGWTLGAGVEYAATDNLIVRAEFLYDDYGSDDFTFNDGSGQNYDAEVDMSASTVRLGIAYKF